MKSVSLALGLSCVFAFSLVIGASQSGDDGPRFTTGMSMARPDYREWIFLASGLGMTYGTPAPNERSPRFTNVFANPSSYRAFMKTGSWPDKTTLVLEIRGSNSEASINKAGFFQTTQSGLELHVKDSRFAGGWAFYNFGDKDVAEPLAGDAVSRCVECHTKNGAVDDTFVQFYPSLLEVARRRGTLKAGS